MEDGTDGDESQRSEFGLATALGADEQVDDVLGSTYSDRVPLFRSHDPTVHHGPLSSSREYSHKVL